MEKIETIKNTLPDRMKKVSFFRQTVALDILLYIHNNPKEVIYSSKLAESLGLPDTQVLSEVYTLEQTGFIRKEKLKDGSKRIRVLKLTQLSQTVIPQIIKIMDTLRKG